jgi:hypothetical protein
MTKLQHNIEFAEFSIPPLVAQNRMTFCRLTHFVTYGTFPRGW